MAVVAVVAVVVAVVAVAVMSIAIKRPSLTVHNNRNLWVVGLQRFLVCR